MNFGGTAKPGWTCPTGMVHGVQGTRRERAWHSTGSGQVHKGKSGYLANASRKRPAYELEICSNGLTYVFEMNEPRLGRNNTMKMIYVADLGKRGIQYAWPGEGVMDE